MNKKKFILVCIFIFLLLFLFPKESGRGGNIPLSEINECNCYGFKRIINVHQTNEFLSVCYGIVGACNNYLDCDDDNQCWHKKNGCKCPGTEFWTEAKGECEAYDGLNNCVCTHEECEGLQPIAG